MARPPIRGRGRGCGAGTGRGVGRPPRVQSEPVDPGRLQRVEHLIQQLQAQLATLTGLVQYLIQQQAAAPVPPEVPPVAPDVIPSVASPVAPAVAEPEGLAEPPVNPVPPPAGLVPDVVANNQQRETRPCIFCGRPHYAKVCPRRYGRCFKCGQPGHIRENCPHGFALGYSTAPVPVIPYQRQGISSNATSSGHPPPSSQSEGARQISGGRVYALTHQEDPPEENPTGTFVAID